jgi:hypothetical protein
MPYTTTGEVTEKLSASLRVKFTDDEGGSQEKWFPCSDAFSYSVGASIGVTKTLGKWDLAGAYDVNPGFREAFFKKR